MKTLISRIIMVLVMSALLAACATPVVEAPRRYFWPPTDEPRIEWIATYFGDEDIKVKNFMTEIVGDESTVKFERPVSAAGNGEGRFMVSDQQLGVFMFDLNKGEVAVLGGSAEAATLGQSAGVAVDAEGKFYVADTYSRKVHVVSKENKILQVINLSEKVKSIGGLAVDRTRARLIVPDARDKKVLVLTLTGELLFTVNGADKFGFPNSVAVTSDGSLVIADSYNALVHIYSAKGEYLKTIGRRGDSPGDLSLVTCVAVDSEDHIYVTDGRLHVVTIFDMAGNVLLVVGGRHSIATGNLGLGGFLVPQGISIDKNDRIYVADTFNKRIQVLQYLNQRYLAEHPITKTGK